MTYRKFYEKELGLILPRGFDVHHIDQNRNNNFLENLVAIPKEIHQGYHKTHRNVLVWKIDGVSIPLGHGIPGNLYFETALDFLNQHAFYRREVCKWIDYKHFLLGRINNIHNLSYYNGNR